MIAVTGATGAVGGLVARGLAAHGVVPQLVVRDPSSARPPAIEGAQVRAASYRDADEYLAR
jgi:NAD(P)H dehydrogenase (quinone)